MKSDRKTVVPPLDSLSRCTVPNKPVAVNKQVAWKATDMQNWIEFRVNKN